jgi:hypothetical protein
LENLRDLYKILFGRPGKKALYGECSVNGSTILK